MDETQRIHVCSLAAKRIIRILLYDGDYTEYDNNNVGLMLDNLRDFHYVFKKVDAEPARKPLGRICMSESLVDQLVHRFFFQSFGDAEFSVFPQAPNLKGIGFDKFSAEKLFSSYERMCEKHGYPPINSDVSGWEKRFGYDTADAAVTVLDGTCSNPSKYTCRATSWWRNTLMRNCLVDAAGNVLRLAKQQGMRSGNFLTNFANGAGRSMCAHYVGSEDTKTNGDDCYEWYEGTLQEYEKAYAEIKLPIRNPFRQTNNKLITSSHVFFRDVNGGVRCYIENWEHCLYKLIHFKQLGAKHETFNGHVHSLCTELVDCPDRSVRVKAMHVINSMRAQLCAE